jgi:hypothetical protein
LGAELREMVMARWELARWEFLADWRAFRCLAIVWLVAAIVALTALPLLLILLAQTLDGCCDLSYAGWLAVFAVGMLGVAFLGGYLAWRRFRRRFLGFQETLEELREDLVWLREMKNEKSQP